MDSVQDRDNACPNPEFTWPVLLQDFVCKNSVRGGVPVVWPARKSRFKDGTTTERLGSLRQRHTFKRVRRYTGVCCATTVRSSWRVWRRSPPFKRKACVTCIGGSAFITDPTTAYAASENLPAQMMERWHGRECHRRSVRPKNAPARRNRVSSRPNSGIPPLRSRNSRIGQGWKTAFIPMLGFLRDGPGNSAGSADFGRADAPRPIVGGTTMIKHTCLRSCS